MLALILWIVFVVYWIIVFQRPMNPETKIAIFSLGALIALTSIYLALWVVHNVRIFQKFGRRRARRQGLPTPLQDFLGRRIVTEDIETLHQANRIEVEVRSTQVKGRTIEEKIITSAEEGEWL